MSDAVKIQLIAAVCGLLSTVLIAAIGAFLRLGMARIEARQVKLQDSQDARAGEIAEKTDEVRRTLAENTAAAEAKLSSISDDVKTAKADGAKVLVHVNSATGNLLRVVAVALRNLAEQTGNPRDAATADVAEKALADHEAGQRMIDQATSPATIAAVTSAAAAKGDAATAAAELTRVAGVPADRPGTEAGPKA